MPRKVFDHEAFEAVIQRARTEGEVVLHFPSAKAAGHFRHSFYLWRAQQRELDPEGSLNFSDIVIRRPEPATIVVAAGWRDPVIRKVLEVR